MSTSTMSKPHFILLTIALAAAVALALAARVPPASEPARAVGSAPDQTRSAVPSEHAPPAPANAVRPSVADSGTRAAEAAMARFGCDVESVACRSEDDANTAGGPKEALWLARHGYPSRADLESYPVLSNAELDELANQDRAFAILRARRQIEQGQVGEGLTALMYLARAGNSYALYEMSRAYREVEEIANFYDAAAYLRLAYMLGDRRAATELYTQFPDWVVPSSMRLIDSRAASLRITMLPKTATDPRPFDD